MRWENISIHAPTRGATIVSVELCDFLLFQSTLPREERHKAQNYLKRYYIISIHAPTRGATLRLINPLPVLCISIHAPTRGATERCTYWMPWGSFQSTLPREERHKAQNYLKRYYIISIHAPTRGATNISRHMKISTIFQSTLPREERLFH